MSTKVHSAPRSGAASFVCGSFVRRPGPGAGVLFVAPVTGAAQVRAAKSAGMSETDNPVVRRIEGDNEAGLAHQLTQQWALAGISLHGLTLAVLGNKFVGYAVFDTVADANRAAQILADLGTAGTPK